MSLQGPQNTTLQSLSLKPIGLCVFFPSLLIFFFWSIMSRKILLQPWQASLSFLNTYGGKGQLLHIWHPWRHFRRAPRYFSSIRSLSSMVMLVIAGTFRVSAFAQCMHLNSLIETLFTTLMPKFHIFKSLTIVFCPSLLLYCGYVWFLQSQDYKAASFRYLLLRLKTFFPFCFLDDFSSSISAASIFWKKSFCWIRGGGFMTSDCFLIGGSNWWS